MGGLAFASIMAKLRKWRVLVLERHFKIGGFTHTFTRPGGWSWDVGLHYVGEMGEGMMGRRLFDFITDGGVKWNPMPDVYDVFVYPALQVSACKGEANFRRVLIDKFPRERANIEQYFQDLKSAMGWINRHFMAMAAPAPLNWIVGMVNRYTAKLPLGVTQQYLESRFRDAQLRAVVTSQWADYGMPPSQSAFATHAVIASHYLNGAWYPDGGAGEIAKATGAIIRAAGGELLANHDVTGIGLEDHRAVGVEVKRRERVPHGISSTGYRIRCWRVEYVHTHAALLLHPILQRAEIAARWLRGGRALSRFAAQPLRDGVPRGESLDIFLF